MALLKFWITRFQIMKYINVNKTMRGATLIESLTALAIVTAVMGAAFTLYNQTIARQAQVLKTRAVFIQNQFEQNQLNEEDLSNEFLTITTEATNYNNMDDIKHITLTISNKQGKKITERHYLKCIAN
ncbi:MAG TPA: hypothetical protein VD905_16350 [Flavobacteriales bacterium]|nr:hypothetical protein [Flavobacteriales bacterium]